MQEIIQNALQFLPDNVWGTIVLLGTLASAIVGLAAAVVKVLAVVAKITPTTKDDEFASKAARAVGVVAHYLDIISLGLNAEQARRTVASVPNTVPDAPKPTQDGGSQ